MGGSEETLGSNVGSPRFQLDAKGFGGGKGPPRGDAPWAVPLEEEVWDGAIGFDDRDGNWGRRVVTDATVTVTVVAHARGGEGVERLLDDPDVSSDSKKRSVSVGMKEVGDG